MFPFSLFKFKRCCCCSVKSWSTAIGLVELFGSIIGLYNGYYTQKEDGNVDSLALFAAVFLLSFILLIGLYKQSRRMVLLWLLVKGCAYGFWTIYYGKKLYDAGNLFAQYNDDKLVSFVIALAALSTFVMLIAWSTILCVYNCYNLLPRKEKHD